MSHKIIISVNAQGQGTVNLDGNDISDLVTAIGINTDVGYPNEITLVMSAMDVELQADIDDVNLVERRLLEDGK